MFVLIHIKEDFIEKSNIAHKLICILVVVIWVGADIIPMLLLYGYHIGGKFHTYEHFHLLIIIFLLS